MVSACVCVCAPHLLRNYVSDINETFTICSSHTGTQNGRVSFESVDYYKSYFGRIIRSGYISLHVPWPNNSACKLPVDNSINALELNWTNDVIDVS